MYLALYRKYRPRTFDDVISQEDITTTLKNQVASGTAAHAYLFTGSRGTGKTTCAKIMAMAVNCLDPKNGNPCLECERCREILDGEATDIVEMDAASNNGVDDVRRLRDEIAYTPVSCRYRVYIIDEVHALSRDAFNALLKTLEEPPEHVKFILATTEQHKVPTTISSRCQRFEFKRVDIAESTERLMYVAEKENVELDRDAAELISRLSDGGMRDALSILDRCVSAGERITTAVVREYAGVSDNAHLFGIAETVAGHDVAGCIRLLSELHKNSKDLAVVIDELSGLYRDFMLCRTVPDAGGLLSALPDDHPKIAEIAGLYELDDILRCLTLLQQCADNIGKTKQRKTLAEMCLVKMCTGLDAVSSSASRPAAGRRQPSSEVQLQPPKNDFVRKSYEEMSERERVTARKTEELIKQTAEKMKAAAKPQPEAPSPEPDKSAEAAPVEEPPQSQDVPPWEELPPEDSFFNNDYPIEGPPDFNPPPEALQPEVGAQQESQAPEIKEPAVKEPEPEKPNEITDEQWQTAVAKLGVMHSSMLAGSKARLSGNVLDVFTANKMLLENVKDEELLNVEKMVCEALGFKITLRINADNASNPDGSAPDKENQSKLDSLLSRARQLGIEVQIKND